MQIFSYNFVSILKNILNFMLLFIFKVKFDKLKLIEEKLGSIQIDNL